MNTDANTTTNTMNATRLLSLAFLRVYFQGPTTHWGIQCIDFDRPLDVRVPVSFNQTYPVPSLVCRSSKRRCYASDEAHAIVAETITVNTTQRVPLRRWPSVDRIPGDGRWPYCFGGGGAKYGGANVTATCGHDGNCLDVCFTDQDVTSPGMVWCQNATSRVPVRWDDGTLDEGWTPWMNGSPRDSIDVIELDSPVVINRATGVGAIARHGSQWVVRRHDGVCLVPMQWTEDVECHVSIHGICYVYDREASVRCIDLLSYPPGAMVALIWRPRLVRSTIQPLEPATTDLFCLRSSRHDPARFLKCLDKLRPLARRGISSLSPFTLAGRSSTVLIRVAPAERLRHQNCDLAQWASIVLSMSVGIIVWALVAIAATRTASRLHWFERWMASVAQKLEVAY